MDEGPRRETSPQNEIQLITWFLFVVAVLSVSTRLATQYAMTSRLPREDFLMLGSLAAYLAQCILISKAAASGLGRASASLTPGSIDNTIKSEYASVPFFILTLALVKLSIYFAVIHLSPNRLHRRINLVLGVITALWYVPATFSSIFQCAIPTPWDYIHGTHCIDRRSWWAFVMVLNVITDLGVVALYILILWKLHISPARKATLMTVFSTRVLVVVAAILQLYEFYNATPSDNVTSALYLPVALKQAVLALSITTACIPYLKPFMNSLEAGVVRIENVPGSEEELSRDRTGSSAYYLNSYGARSSPGCSSNRASEA
ncbi:hypothetical protein F4777DRAFT_558196 [Nemania sp. FL0916]|nr:hypothetical protein F4777DRAFT_558196 [Nemania sp. FL0916]